MEYFRFALTKLREYKLKAKLRKSGFGLTTADYLGHVIKAGTIEAGPSKVSAVRDWPTPTDIKQLQSFLGLSNYYNRFIQRFAHIAAPLTELLARNAPFVWDIRQQKAFAELKEKLCTTPVLQLPNFDYDIVLKTDASAFALGASLMQNKGSGLQLVSYFSKNLSDAETCYSPHEVELLAIVQAFEKFRPYVDSRHTTVRIDLRPLTYVNTQPTLSNKQIRWMQTLGRFTYMVKYKHSITNVAVDRLSKRPDHFRTRENFVHFADQCGHPLTSVQTFSQDSPMTCNFVRTIRPERSTIRKPIGTNTSTTIDDILGQKGIIGNDRALLNAYLQQTQIAVNFGRLPSEMGCQCIVNGGKTG